MDGVSVDSSEATLRGGGDTDHSQLLDKSDRVSPAKEGGEKKATNLGDAWVTIQRSSSTGGGVMKNTAQQEAMFWPRIYLVTWFLLNVVITLYSKAVFSLYKFPYPLLVTATHMLFTMLGGLICQMTGTYRPKSLDPALNKTILWFSVIFTANIWLSNASLLAVSVNLHQVIRTTIPLFTMVLSHLVFGESYPLTLLPSVLLVVVGVALTIWGDVAFSAFGMIVVVLGCFLSSLKGIITQRTQVGELGLSSLDLLRYICPLAVLQLSVLAFLLGEVSDAIKNVDVDRWMLLHLSSLGWVAFGLNFVSFRCAALLSPLTLNIAGNVKQVLTGLLSLLLFGGRLSNSLAIGIIGTSFGAYWYSVEMHKWKVAASKVEVTQRKRPRTPSVSSRPSEKEADSLELVDVASGRAGDEPKSSKGTQQVNTKNYKIKHAQQCNPFQRAFNSK